MLVLDLLEPPGARVEHDDVSVRERPAERGVDELDVRADHEQHGLNRQPRKNWK